MPFEVAFDHLPQGVCVSPTRAEDSTVDVLTTEYVSTEDGQLLVERLEGFVDNALRLIPQQQRPRASQIDHMLVIVRRDRSATIYINELTIHGRVRSNREIKKGEAIGLDDISDIVRLDIGVDIPADAGVLFLLSHRWRRGLFYDWRPLTRGGGEPRTDDLRVVFGQMQAHLTFQEFHSLTEADWDGFFAEQWFPFKSLKRATLIKMRDYVKSEWSIDALLPEIIDQVKSSVESWVTTWKRDRNFSSHTPVFEKAVDHFLNGEHLALHI